MERGEALPPRRSPAAPALPAQRRGAMRSGSAPRGGSARPSALPADLKPRTARRSRCASRPAGPAERSQARAAARAAGEARGAGSPHLSLSREVLSAAAAGGTRFLPLSTKKAGADSPGPAKLRAVAEPGSHLQRPSDSGSRHGTTRLGSARLGSAPHGSARPPPPHWSRRRPASARPPGAPAGAAVGSALRDPRPAEPAAGTGLRGARCRSRRGQALMQALPPGPNHLNMATNTPSRQRQLRQDATGKTFLNSLCVPPSLARQPAALAIGILWPQGHPAGLPPWHRPSLLCHGNVWQCVPEKYPGVTAHLLTAKSKSTCLNAPFPAKETLHHSSSFVPAWSF